MATGEFQTLLETVIEELEAAVPHLVVAETALKEAWSRIVVREAGDPGRAMTAMIEGVGGLLTWVQNMKAGTE